MRCACARIPTNSFCITTCSRQGRRSTASRTEVRRNCNGVDRKVRAVVLLYAFLCPAHDFSM